MVVENMGGAQALHESEIIGGAGCHYFQAGARAGSDVLESDQLTGRKGCGTKIS